MVFKVKYLLTFYEATKPPFRRRFGQPLTPVYLWGFATSREDVEEERKIVERELTKLREVSEFDLEFSGGYIISTEDEVFEIADELQDSDAIMVFGTCDFANILEAVCALNKPTIIFIKLYLGEHLYAQAEVVNPRFLRGETDTIFVKDRDIFVVFDNYGRVLRILRALNALKRARETVCLCLGVPYGWQMRYREVRAAQKKLGFKVRYASYSRFKKILEEIRDDKEAFREAKELADAIINKASKIVEPSKEDLLNAAIAYLALKRLLREKKANAITISDCFITFPGIAGTPPCLPLSLLNDEGIVAGCEGDFSAFAAQLLLCYVSNRPVMFLDPIVHPEVNKVILAHCTSPLRLEGYEGGERPLILRNQDALRSGVGVQALHKEGEEITMIDPGFELETMVIMKGRITRNTDYPICRNQFEVEISDGRKLWNNLVGFHWVAAYGRLCGGDD
ncbi:MAG: hypothetical protein DRJ59_01245 [Thermoprotei archaeon]|nr:MAG: hypothetical protein DRJ59_01245 [Thermoprotei archaeon]